MIVAEIGPGLAFFECGCSGCPFRSPFRSLSLPFAPPNVNGHPILPDFGPGPMEALDEFLKTNSSFTIDAHRERFGLTFNPRGYLKKVH